MKVARGTLGRSLMMVVCLLVLSGSVLCQSSDECMAVYHKFLDNRKGPEMMKLQAAIGAGKEYLSKCGTLADGGQIKDYITKGLPKLEDTVAAKQEMDELKTALDAKNAELSFVAGKKVLARDPNNVDIMLALALAGRDAAYALTPVDKFNNDTIQYATNVLAKLKDPATSVGYFKASACGDGRATAIGAMNAVVGYITWDYRKDQKAALSYLYQSTQTGCSTKSNPETYKLIGSSYQAEFERLDADRLAKAKAAGDKDTDETKAIYALELGYLERMMDAYGRAYNLANADEKFDAAKKTTLLTKVKEVYNARHDDNPAGFDDWLKGLSSKPFPDPSSKVEPVVAPPEKP